MDAAGGMSADAALVDHIARGKGSSKAAMVELLGRYSKTPALLPAPLARRRRSSPARSSRIHAARKRLGPDSIQQLVADYEAGDSTTILMRTYGLGKGTVLAILEEQGVKMRGQGIPDDRLSEVSDLYSGGLSLMRISKKLDCSAETVRQALLRAGVTLRRQQERGPL
jgi:DNA-directed RNA polymerase specialized sigma24 family protein